MPDLILHKYQENAIDFGIEVKTPFFAIDMGLGKTIITLKMLEYLGTPAVIFAPIRPMYDTWPAEIKKWDIKLSYAILHGPNKLHTYLNNDPDIWLINYDGLKWLGNTIIQSKKKWRKRVPVLDESSMVKSHSTARFKMFKKMFPLWLDYRACLSATPAPNGYHQLWSQYYFLDKGKALETSYTRFRSMHFSYTGPPVFKTSLLPGHDKLIRDKVAPITYRLDAKDYIDMPEIIYNDIKLTLPKKAREAYKELEDEFTLAFDSCDVTAFNAGALSNKLRQFVQGALYTDERSPDFYPVHLLKVEALKDLLDTMAGQPLLCPIQFKFERKMINTVLKMDVPCIAGGTPSKLASQYIKQWNNGDLPLLLCHPASLGHGVNIQSGGHNVLWYGLPWSLEHYKQLNGRLWRQGQRKGVVINHLLIEDTIDVRIAKVLRKKDSVQNDLLNALRR